MAGPERPFVETRYAQMFPTLTPTEIARLRRFGEVRRHAAGEQLVRTGEPSPGMLVVLSGELAVSQHNVLGRSEPIVTHEPGGFMGELAQLSGRPALVDAVAVKPVEILVIPSRSLRDVLVAEAELGERIMRALILRRVGLLETGLAGPVIIGHAGSSDVLRLAEFLRRNGHPHHTLDPDLDSCAKTLLDRFEIAASELPIVLCPNYRCCAIPPRARSPAASVWFDRSTLPGSTTSPSSAPDRPALRRRSTRLPKGFR
jgi:thioredoxin reductase (NADPH)